MARQREAYRFRLKPNAEQQQAMNRLAGARRYLFNWGLARKKEYYKTTGKTLA